MKKITLTQHFTQYESIEELSDAERNLMKTAQNAVSAAYAPYSQFYVGAAVLLGNGIIVMGNNQENAAYPSGLCAERVALFYAAAQYPNEKIIAIALCARTDKVLIDKPVAPCGACRQVIAEYEFKGSHKIEILMMGEKGPIFKSESISNLLPLMFSKTDLGIL